MRTVFDSMEKPIYYPYPQQPKKHKHFKQLPTNEQQNRLNLALTITKKYVYKSKQTLIDELISNNFQTPTDKRIYKSGGIGTYTFLRKKKCFRLQLAASHINKKTNYMPYALCIDIY